MKIYDFEGQRFGKLVALRVERSNRTKWLCICDCGNQIWALQTNLKNGHTKSCGCLRSGSKPIDDRKARILAALQAEPAGVHTAILRQSLGLSVQSVNSVLRALEDDGEAVRVPDGAVNRWFWAMHVPLIRAEKQFLYGVRP